jgi:hypothetical protein
MSIVSESALRSRFPYCVFRGSRRRLRGFCCEHGHDHGPLLAKFRDAQSAFIKKEGKMAIRFATAEGVVHAIPLIFFALMPALANKAGKSAPMLPRR